MKKILATLAVCIAILPFVPQSFAAGITISPPKFELDATPGQVIRSVVKITNTDTDTLILTPSVQDFVASGETGQPKFVDAKDSDPAISLSNWVNVNQGKTVTAPPRRAVEVPFVVTVPQDAEPGGHYGAVFFAPPAGSGQVGVTQRIGALILIRVKGDVTESGALDIFGAYDKDLEGEKLHDVGSNTFYSSLPVNFTARYQNTGNIHLKPTGKIEISNFGIKLNEIGVQSILNDGGVEISKEIVNFLPVNNERGNTLAKSFRSYHTTWEGTPYWYYNEDGTKEIRYKGFPLGYYTATLTLDGAGGKSETATTHFIILPWKEALVTVVTLLALYFGGTRFFAWRSRKLEAEFKKKFGVK